LDTHITDGVTEEDIGAILIIGVPDGVTRVGATLAIGDLDTTDTTITLIVMEEEVLHLITETETMLLIEVTPTEVSQQTETILPEILLLTEATIQIETIPPIDKTGIQISEEVPVQTEETIILQILILPIEEIQLRVKAIATTTLTEDQATVHRLEIKTTAITAHHQEVTLQVHHVL
jgi:hypothetical protein